MKRKPPLLDKPYPKHRPVSEGETELWLEAVKEPAHTALPKSSKPAPKREAVRVKKQKPYAKPAVQTLDRTTHAKIRRGAFAIEATLDLHGHTRDTAHRLLTRFIAEAQARGYRTVLVISGKGGEHGGVLRRLLPLWLDESPLRERIIAYDSASARHGGSGAWYIRIRKKGTHDSERY